MTPVAGARLAGTVHINGYSPPGRLCPEEKEAARARASLLTYSCQLRSSSVDLMDLCLVYGIISV